LLRFALVPLALTGCYPLDLDAPESTGDFEPRVAWNDGLETQRIEPESGTLRGAFPVIGSFDRTVSEGSIRFTNREIDLDLHSTDPNWAMLGGWVDASVLTMGEWTSLDHTNHFVLGCSGPSMGSMAYDDSAEAVRVWIDAIDTPDGPMLELEVDAAFSGGWNASTVVVVADPRHED
jgi:hypothetical protein